MVHQHFSLVPTLTVTENIILGHEPVKAGLIDRAGARKMVETLMQQYDLHADPDAITGTLSVAAQQKVEILKALARRTRLLILDEPTAVLSPPEIEELMRRLKSLRDDGITILFISHKLNEVRELAESVTVLRAGAVAGTEKLADVPDDAIMQMVMGHAVDIPKRAHQRGPGRTVLEMKDVTQRPPTLPTGSGMSASPLAQARSSAWRAWTAAASAALFPCFPAWRLRQAARSASMASICCAPIRQAGAKRALPICPPTVFRKVARRACRLPKTR